VVVQKYLIKLWKCDNSDLIATLDWESNQNVDELINDTTLCLKNLSKSLSLNLRATIEVKC